MNKEYLVEVSLDYHFSQYIEASSEEEAKELAIELAHNELDCNKQEEYRAIITQTHDLDDLYEEDD